MSFNAIACLDFWEEVLYSEVIAEHPHWPLLRIHRIGGLCVGLRVHAERVVRRFVEFAIIYTIPHEERLLAECANMRAPLSATMEASKSCPSHVRARPAPPRRLRVVSESCPSPLGATAEAQSRVRAREKVGAPCTVHGARFQVRFPTQIPDQVPDQIPGSKFQVPDSRSGS